MIGPLAYVGGKNRLAKKIIKLFPRHKTYAEPFAGGAQVFFRKEPSQVEVLNDLDGEIVNFFRVCQWHHQELVRYLRYCLVSRKLYEILQVQDPRHLTDVQRAGRFLYLQKNSFGGLVLKQNYHYTVTSTHNYNAAAMPQLIERTSERLQRTQIENLPYEQVLARYDRATTLFYLDPPYWGRKLYRFNFTEEDFMQLRDRLSRIQGKFVLSLNDVPEVRQLFRAFTVRSLKTTYTAQRKAGSRYRELLITNFAPPKP